MHMHRALRRAINAYESPRAVPVVTVSAVIARACYTGSADASATHMYCSCRSLVTPAMRSLSRA